MNTLALSIMSTIKEEKVLSIAHDEHPSDSEDEQSWPQSGPELDYILQSGNVNVFRVFSGEGVA